MTNKISSTDTCLWEIQHLLELINAELDKHTKILKKLEKHLDKLDKDDKK